MDSRDERCERMRRGSRKREEEGDVGPESMIYREAFVSTSNKTREALEVGGALKLPRVAKPCPALTNIG